MVDEPAPSTPTPKLTEKDRARLLRQQMRGGGEEGFETVMVKHRVGPAPKGIRFITEIDTSTNTFNLHIEPSSAEGMISFLDRLRWVARSVGVDFDIKKYEAPKEGKDQVNFL